jgi:geranylgeranyl diphosphate synthase, type I
MFKTAPTTTSRSLLSLEYAVFVRQFRREMARRMVPIVQNAYEYHADFGDGMAALAEGLASSPYKRPYFMHLGYRAYGGNDDRMALQAIFGLELYDAALLLHDDIIDDDTVRNGRPNLYGWHTARLQERLPEADAKKRGASLAMLYGDMLFGLAYEQLLGLPVPQPLLRAVQSELARTNYTLNSGQVVDVLGEMSKLEDVSDEEIIKAYALKNQFNVEMPFRIGALLANSPYLDMQRVHEFTYPLGVAIQIVNDNDLLFSPQYDDKTASDLRDNKTTLILWHAWQKATPVQRRHIKACLGNPAITRQDVELLKYIFTRTGARGRTNALCRRLCQKVLEELAMAPNLDPKAVARLRAYVRSLLMRAA